METAASQPKDLARALRDELRDRGRRPPALKRLTTLLETMYFASLQTEEAEALRFHVVYLDSRNPDPNPPGRIVKDRWSYIRLDRPVKITDSNLVKIAKASDPRSSSFAVFHDADGILHVWGLIDQQNRYHDYLNYDTDAGPERPGLFEASVLGTGHLAVTIGYEKVAELRINELARNTIDVLNTGPVSDALGSGINLFLDVVSQRVSTEYGITHDDWVPLAASQWLQCLCRLLLRIQGLGHGGAIVITPETDFTGLNPKYKVSYERLRKSLEGHASLTARKLDIDDEIHDILESDADEIPALLHLDDAVIGNDIDETESELDGAIWFIALLSRVDGAVALTPALDVLGFGVEITIDTPPRNVVRAADAKASKRKRSSVDYNHFGTRHRSMMRYCNSVPGSLGFVVSQDGDVRAMHKIADDLVIWENLRLQVFRNINRNRSS